MIIPIEIAKNFLMGIGPVAKYAQKRHTTGVGADSSRAREVFEFYSTFIPVEGKDVLEIGPGQCLEVLGYALAAGAKTCTAVDIVDYVPPTTALNNGVSYEIYDGRKLPFESERFDVIWAYTAFEHLRYPALTVAECFRVLREGGRLVSLIDLADHSFYGMEGTDPAKLFHCLGYPEWLWNLMKWNRSSFVNRLRKSDWLGLFEDTGFRFRHTEARESEETIQALPGLKHLHKYSREDAVTQVLTVCLEKPAA